MVWHGMDDGDTDAQRERRKERKRDAGAVIKLSFFCASFFLTHYIFD